MRIARRKVVRSPELIFSLAELSPLVRAFVDDVEARLACGWNPKGRELREGLRACVVSPTPGTVINGTALVVFLHFERNEIVMHSIIMPDA